MADNGNTSAVRIGKRGQFCAMRLHTRMGEELHQQRIDFRQRGGNKGHLGKIGKGGSNRQTKVIQRQAQNMRIAGKQADAVQ